MGRSVPLTGTVPVKSRSGSDSVALPVSILVLTHDDVVRLLPMDECIDLMHDTLARPAGGSG